MGLVYQIVALRKESVDRNITTQAAAVPFKLVALRKESVDRNKNATYVGIDSSVSLSARRAWIEILELLADTAENIVALRKESVDRNP